MKKLKTLFIAIMVIVTAVVATAILAGCTKYEFTEAVVNRAEGQEEMYAFCVQKGNSTLLAQINAFFAKEETKTLINKSLEYHEGDKGEGTQTPVDASILSDNTGKTITMVTEAGFAPYEYIGSGKGSVQGYVGLDVDLMIQFCEDNNYKLAIKDTEFDSIFLELGENKEEAVNYIGAAGITIKPARKEKVDFATPYITTYQAIISSKENGYKTLDQLAGLNIGVQAGTTGQDIAEEYNKTAENDKKIKKIKDYSQVMQAFLDLKAGRIAAVIIDEAVAMQLVK